MCNSDRVSMVDTTKDDTLIHKRVSSWQTKIDHPESDSTTHNRNSLINNEANSSMIRDLFKNQVSLWQTKINDPTTIEDTKIQRMVVVNCEEIKDEFKGQVSKWKQKVVDHREQQLMNPFSEWEGASHRAKMDKNDPTYGTPIPGSLTEIRGKQAANQVFAEIMELCHAIDAIGEKGEDGKMRITFGKLFSAYESVSNKVVGMLMRARKRECVSFEGEMLYQGRDEGVLITLLEIPEDKREKLEIPKFMSGGFE